MIHASLRRSLALLFFVLAAFSSHAQQPADDASRDPRDLRLQIRELNRALERTPRIEEPSQQQAEAVNMAALMQTRSKLVEQLIQTNPQAIRDVLMSPGLLGRVNKIVPAQATSVETAGQWSGMLEATIADDFEHGRSTTQYYLHSGDVRRQLFFANPQNLRHIIHRPVIVNGVGTSKLIAVESLRPMIQTAGSGSPGLNCTPTGVENVAVLIMNQPSGGATYPASYPALGTSSYWDPIYFGSSAKSANNFWQEASFGLASGTGAFEGSFNFTQSEDCTNTDQLATDAIAAAQADGIDFSNYSRISIIYPVNTCNFGGLGTVGCYAADTRISHPYSITWIPVQPYYNTTSYQFWGLLAHELGHNLGLHHSSSLYFGNIPLGAIDYVDPYPTTSGYTASAGEAVRTEYGDNYTIMGQGSWACGAQYTAFNKAEYLTWMSRTSDVQEVTSSGSFQVVPFENSSGLRGLRILRDPLSSSWIWMEYRQALGDYDSALSACETGSNILQGANVYYESPYSEDGHLFLLDMNAATTPNNFLNNALTPGNSWSDPYSLLTLSVTAANSSGVSITANYDQPCASLNLSSGVFPAAGGSGTITVTAPNTCSWTATTVDSWITITSGGSGSGNGTVGFTLSSNASNVAQRNGYITVQRQSLPVAQKGAATFASNLSPVVQSGLSSVLNFTFTDPLGTSDISTITATIGSADCQIYIEQSSGVWFMFLLDPYSESYSSSIQIGASQSASNANCTLNGSTSTVSTNGNTLQLGLGLTFQQSFAGSYRVTAAVSDSQNSSPSDVAIGTYQVPAAVASVNQISPASGKQGATAPITITGSNTHFSSSSTITLSGAGVAVSGISSSSGTQLNAAFTIATNATIGPQTVTVTTGAEVVTGTFTVNASGQALLSTTSLSFAPQQEETTSGSQPVTLTNNGTTTLNLLGIAHSANFGESDNCGSSLAVNATCTLNITFTPTALGTLSGTITISDDSPSSPYTIDVSGYGNFSTTLSHPQRPNQP